MHTKGTITTVQRLSIHDGPGIRATIFFKGCNLRCKWCHNPETWRTEPQLQFVAGKCIGCGGCVQVCPNGTLTMGGGKPEINWQSCDACGKCAMECPSGALSIVGEVVTAEEVMRRIVPDKPFFDESGGGVTLSGGEPLMQPAFARDILTLCRQKGIHTAVETNLTAQESVIKDLLPVVDLWMCDLKIADATEHKKWIGTSNGHIIENLRFLAGSGVQLIIRTPVVPGVNDTETAVRELRSVVKSLPGAVCYELLGFHCLGFDKFVQLGMVNLLVHTPQIEKNKLAMLREIVSE